MKKHWLWLLAPALAACGDPVSIATDVAVRHQHEAALRQQAKLLQASAVKVSATAATGGPTVLRLDVVLPRDQPQRPDTLKQRARKLAHLLVADLAQPAKYQVLSVQVVERKGYFDKEATSQSFIYPLASLR